MRLAQLCRIAAMSTIALTAGALAGPTLITPAATLRPATTVRVTGSSSAPVTMRLVNSVDSPQDEPLPFVTVDLFASGAYAGTGTTDANGDVIFDIDLLPQPNVWVPVEARVNGLPVAQFELLRDGGNRKYLRLEGNIVVPLACPGDSNGDGTVDFADITDVLAKYSQPAAATGTPDPNDNRVYDFGDITTVLALFGESCPLPIAPSNLVPANVWATRIDLNWTDNSGNEREFRVAMSRTGPNGNFDNIGTTGPGRTGFRVENLQPNTCYWFKVRARNEFGFSPYTNTIQICTPPIAPPAAPTNLVATNVWPRTVDLNWQQSSTDETGFRVAMSTTGPNGNFNNIDTLGVDATSYRVTGLSPNACYWFKVRAFNAAGDSVYTNTLEVCTPQEPPIAPSGLVITDVNPCSIQIAWADNANNESEYRVAIGTAGPDGQFNNAAVLPAGSTAITLNDLCPSTTYWVKVRAGNGAGFSDYSQTVSVTTGAVRAPSNLNAARDNATPAPDVLITWTASSGCVDAYRIARSTNGGASYNALVEVPATTTSYRDTTVQSGVTYTYIVRAVKYCNGSPFYSDYTLPDSANP
jgi:chitodextrinase